MVSLVTTNDTVVLMVDVVVVVVMVVVAVVLAVEVFGGGDGGGVGCGGGGGVGVILETVDKLEYLEILGVNGSYNSVIDFFGTGTGSVSTSSGMTPTAPATSSGGSRYRSAAIGDIRHDVDSVVDLFGILGPEFKDKGSEVKGQKSREKGQGYGSKMADGDVTTWRPDGSYAPNPESVQPWFNEGRACADVTIALTRAFCGPDLGLSAASMLSTVSAFTGATHRSSPDGGLGGRLRRTAGCGPLVSLSSGRASSSGRQDGVQSHHCFELIEFLSDLAPEAESQWVTAVTLGPLMVLTCLGYIWLSRGEPLVGRLYFATWSTPRKCDFQDLRYRIVEVFCTVTPGMLLRAWTEIEYRLRVTEGAHVEDY
ncbi:hypothetical protein PR048_002182 [Dryococelus australis]|uniref:Uncharacterized protein n=1 Tax=Dryococelus australis TaxID=614101 RepID=A0ABQ9IJH0_9NEOP|nr:hypothetical protein PR048_002182 [Dryococelus australis]